MNRLVLIGNGFDLAHGLKTSYKDFIYWYWKQRISSLYDEGRKTSTDVLCSITTFSYRSWKEFLYYNSEHIGNTDGEGIYSFLKSNDDSFRIVYSPLLERIMVDVDTKGWVDIENDYYELLKDFIQKDNSVNLIEELHRQFEYLKDKFLAYLCNIEIKENIKNNKIENFIYSAFKRQDISVEGQKALNEHIKYWKSRGEDGLKFKSHIYGVPCTSNEDFESYLNGKAKQIPQELLMPDQIMLLSFNYTDIAQKYCKDFPLFSVNQIHGFLSNPLRVIFGYGDELDENYKSILNKNENKYLRYIKSIKYLESNNYRNLLTFIDSSPYQVLIMGHSCGNSDRTLLNTIFEHQNCVSIKPYYYINEKGEDNFLDIVQNISRNFTDMKMMRDRVVNKFFCEPMTDKRNVDTSQQQFQQQNTSSSTKS